MLKKHLSPLLLLALLSNASLAQWGIPNNLNPEQQGRLAKEQALERQPQEEQMRMQIAQAATPEQHMQVARNAIIQQRDMLRELELLLGQINSPYTANRKASSIQAISQAYRNNHKIEEAQLQQLPPRNMAEMEHMYQEQLYPLLHRVQQQVYRLSHDADYYNSPTLKNATYFFLR